MVRPLALALFTTLPGSLAVTQTAQAETVLHLAETATVLAAPDEIAATLRVEATSTSAATAQSRVNTAMQDALAQARKVDGVTVSTGGYGVWRIGPMPNDHWQVSETLNLTGHDGPALLTLVGDLQQHGLAVSNLGWRLSRAGEKQSREAATKQALTALHGRVDEVAALLDLRFGQFKEIRLDSPAPQPMFRAMAAPMAMSPASAPPPAVAPEDIPISATAEADATLIPK